jgi:hypothetical protein
MNILSLQILWHIMRKNLLINLLILFSLLFYCTLHDNVLYGERVERFSVLVNTGILDNIEN